MSPIDMNAGPQNDYLSNRPAWQTRAPVPEAPAPVSVNPPQPTAGQNTALQEQLQQQVYGQLPGYAVDMSNIGANISAETAGKLPQDVINELQQVAAERGIGTGTYGSDDSNASYLRALGLDSLSLTNLGQQNLTGILPTLPGANAAANPNFYVTPQENLQVSIANAEAQNNSAQQAAALQAAMAGLGAGGGGGGAPGAFSLPGTPQTSASQPGANPGYNLDYRGTPATPGFGPSTQDWLASIGQQYAQTVAGATAPQSGWGNEFDTPVNYD